MPILTEGEVREAARAEYQQNRRYTEDFASFSERQLSEHKTASTYRTAFDVFLSHSFGDKELILGVRRVLEGQGMVVYIDWVDDPQLDRTLVQPTTAAVIKRRMHQSKSLLYATSAQAAGSKWMPWELGYFDGFRSKVGVLPLSPDQVRPGSYSGREYLGLYPYVGPCSLSSAPGPLCVFDGSGGSVPLKGWL